MHRELPVGIFDSGIGGLTVYKQLRKLMPGENIIYFGDTGRAPYGSRSTKQIAEFTDEILRLMSLCSVKVGVVACNTITVLGVEKLSAHYNFDLIGNSTGALTALRHSPNTRIGVLATETTIASGKHRADILALDSEAMVVPVPCPKFAPLIEAGIFDGPEMRQAAEEYLRPLKEAQIEAVILGCTHYPYIAPVLQDMMGAAAVVVDPAEETAQKVKAYLEAKDASSVAQSGKSALYFSANPARARKIAEKIFDTRNLDFQLLDIAPLEKYYHQNLAAEA